MPKPASRSPRQTPSSREAEPEQAMRAAAGLDAQGKAAEAGRSYRAIVERRPEYAPAWAALAFHAFREGNLPGAVQLTERCVTLDPGSALHWRNLCEFRRRAGAAASAVAAGRRALDMSPADPEAYHNLSLALGDANQVADAIAVARRLPVWMLDRHNSEWRWMAPREDSPWYPMMRIFRQSRPGEWSDVVARTVEAMCSRLDTG